MCFYCSSDADPNLLSDYILALLKKKTSQEKIRTLVEQELETFMNERKPIIFLWL